MSVLLPPPKRQKSAYSQSLLPPAPPVTAAPVPSVVVQFKSAEDGSNLGPAINLPADTGRDALQMLVNKLRGEVRSCSATLQAGDLADVRLNRMKTLCPMLFISCPAHLRLPRLRPLLQLPESRSTSPSWQMRSLSLQRPRRLRLPFRLKTSSSCGVSRKQCLESEA
jgi:hypothetical protein